MTPVWRKSYAPEDMEHPCGIQICVYTLGKAAWTSWACTHRGLSVCLCSLREKLQAILKATYTHSRNLACFVFTYKGLHALQSHVQGETHQMHTFLAAFIGGLLLFGENNNINSQVKAFLRWAGASGLPINRR